MEEILRVEKVSKQFSGVRVLTDVDFSLQKGEVHVLLGENGAGKSTLMNIISGLRTYDSGAIYVEGQQVRFHNAKEAQTCGIGFIHQEFYLIPELTVAQNVFLGRELKKNGRLDMAKMCEETKKLLEMLRADIGVNQKISQLGVAQQQLVEVAKALSQHSKILIMDEPTATLSKNEISNLFETIRRLKRDGVSIIYISHRLEEIKQIGDRATVLRDGHMIATKSLQEVELSELIHLMVGREVTNNRIRKQTLHGGATALRVENLRDEKLLKGVSMYVNRGEVVALAGLVGAGRTELVHSVFGVRRYTEGKVFLSGEEIGKPTPRKSVRRKLGLLPESRKENGLCLDMTISSNITQVQLKKIAKAGILNLTKEKEVAKASIQSLNIACAGTEQRVRYLSGGNQQKVVLGKWLFSDCDILVFDEPTRGIDVGAKEEIYRLIDMLANQGFAILIVSSDLPEILSISDRIYVMRDGRIEAELDAEKTTQAEILGYAARGNKA